jgi:hypothetical protein
MSLGGVTTHKIHVAQTVLSAVCGFSSLSWPKAADLPRKRAGLRYTISFSRATTSVPG